MARLNMTDFSHVEEEPTAGPAGVEVTRCHDCGAAAPRTNTNYTLISSSHGWRLTLELHDGRRVSIWRCPKCWKQHKGK